MNFISRFIDFVFDEVINIDDTLKYDRKQLNLKKMNKSFIQNTPLPIKRDHSFNAPTSKKDKSSPKKRKESIKNKRNSKSVNYKEEEIQSIKPVQKSSQNFAKESRFEFVPRSEKKQPTTALFEENSLYSEKDYLNRNASKSFVFINNNNENQQNTSFVSVLPYDENNQNLKYSKVRKQRKTGTKCSSVDLQAIKRKTTSFHSVIHRELGYFKAALESQPEIMFNNKKSKDVI